MEWLDFRHTKAQIFRFIAVWGVSFLAVCRCREELKDGEKTQNSVTESGITDFISNNQILNHTFTLGSK